MWSISASVQSEVSSVTIGLIYFHGAFQNRFRRWASLHWKDSVADILQVSKSFPGRLQMKGTAVTSGEGRYRNKGAACPFVDGKWRQKVTRNLSRYLLIHTRTHPLSKSSSVTFKSLHGPCFSDLYCIVYKYRMGISPVANRINKQKPKSSEPKIFLAVNKTIQ